MLATSPKTWVAKYNMKLLSHTVLGRQNPESEAGASPSYGTGRQPPTPPWGTELSIKGSPSSLDMRRTLARDLPRPYAIMVTVLAYNLLGDVVRDVLDPRLRGSR